MRVVVLIWLLLATGEARSEVIELEGFGTIELNALECVEVSRSRMIRRICYDEWTRYMLVDIEGQYRLFCGVDRRTIDGFVHAKSMAQFFAQIRREHGCRSRPAAQ